MNKKNKWACGCTPNKHGLHGLDCQHPFSYPGVHPNDPNNYEYVLGELTDERIEETLKEAANMRRARDSKKIKDFEA